VTGVQTCALPISPVATPEPTTPAITQPVAKPATPSVAAAPAGPVPVSASQVKRLSGDAPNLRTVRMDDLPKVISAKMCIDTSGNVSSVNIIQSIDGRFVKELQATLKRWRYAPYMVNGSARAACFVVPMRTK
jgi:hypothetical protein